MKSVPVFEVVMSIHRETVVSLLLGPVGARVI